MQIALNEGHFCFEMGSDGLLRASLLNRDVATQELRASFDTLFRNQAGYSPDMVPADVRNMTFADIDGRELRAPKSPSKRCLNFHMHVAWEHAVQKGWVDADAVPFSDYGTDGEYGMKTFLEAAALATEIATTDEDLP